MSELGARRRQSSVGALSVGSSAGGLAQTTASNTASSSSSSATSVQVAVRIRPLNPHDVSTIPNRWQRTVVHAVGSNALSVESGGPPPPGVAPTAGNQVAKKQAFTFDRVLSPSDGQEVVFRTSAEPLIHRFLEGYNVTILAYGQTSSGKSYTMGTAADVDFEALVAGGMPDANIGIIPRAVAQIFSQIRDGQRRGGGVQYAVKVSFIEIYNEELIDLLNDAEGDARPLVQIREDKAGHILWQGLREVRVNSVADVMNHLLQGSTYRRTNETEMNAQSSRSHAIFSLTLTQKKWAGAGAPPAAPSAASASGIRPPSSFGGRTTPTGRSTPLGARTLSGLPRPASTMFASSRVTSPTAASGVGGGLRPNSVMGSVRSTSPLPGGGGGGGADEKGEGEWVTTTSKFHFVDLAGSERLKRTAAKGERAKEGISINAGLHALGNVISALGDPAKAKRTTHIPYRDSKLTRLLQDSLGGNAYTLMIACVSPAEYNVSETVNTLQYAHRARNIKNKAEINEVEVGWDDVEYLQGLVTKLRKELGLVRNAKAGTPGSEAALRSLERKDELEWRDKYAALSQKHSQLVADFTKLQQMPRQTAQNNNDFLQAAEPIIVEYEKTLDALEGQINLLKAAVSHSEDIITEQEAELRDKAQRLGAAEQDLEMRETTISELQARLAKLQDRETTAEGYTRELEQRLQTITASGAQDSQVTAELRREVARLKESEASTEQYVKELENRLVKADESVAQLQSQLERVEKDVVRRDESYRELQQRMELLDGGKANKELLEELDERDARLLEVERKLDALRAERDDAVRERGRLNDSMAKHQLDKGKLEDRVRELEQQRNTAPALAAAAAAAPSASQSSAASTKDGGADTATDKDTSKRAAELDALKAELESLRASEERRRAELEAVNEKYRESLSEIQDLSHQLAEAKLNGDGPRTPHLDRRSSSGAGDEEVLEVLEGPETPERSRGEASGGGDGGGGSRSLARRSSWNQFSSTTPTRPERKSRPESLLLDRKTLARRSSGSFLGYNPREPTPREGIPPSPISAHPPGGSGSASSSRAASPSRLRSRSMSQSLSEELRLGGGRRPLSLTATTTAAAAAAAGAGIGGALSTSSSGHGSEGWSAGEHDRELSRLRNESSRLQEALRERDEEIAGLERRLRERGGGKAPTAGRDSSSSSAGSSDETRFVDSASAPDSRLSTPPPPMPPSALAGGANAERELSLVKQLIVDTRSESGEIGDGAMRLDDLMRSMARKEAKNREHIEDLTGQLTALRREHSALQSLSKDQAANMASELEGLRAQLAAYEGAGAATPKPNGATADEGLMRQELEELRRANKKLAQERQGASQGTETSDAESAPPPSGAAGEPSSVSVPLAAQASRAMHLAKPNGARGQSEADGAVASDRGSAEDHATRTRELEAEHAAALRRTSEERESALWEQEKRHEQALASLQEGHDAALTRAQSEAKLGVEQARAEVARARRAHEAELAELAASHQAKLRALQQEHASERERLENAKVEAVSAAVAAAAKEHSSSLQSTEVERIERHNAAVAALQREAVEERHAALAEARRCHDDELERLGGEHRQRLAERDETHERALSALREEHDAGKQALQREHGEYVSRLIQTHQEQVAVLEGKLSEQEKRLTERDEAVQSLQAKVPSLEADHRAALERQMEDHAKLVSTLKVEHTSALAAAAAEAASTAEERHRAEVQRLNEEHSAALERAQKQGSEGDEELRRLRDDHMQAIERLEADLSKTRDALSQAEEKHQASVAELKKMHAAEVGRARTNMELHQHEAERLRSELEALQAAHDEAQAELKKSSERGSAAQQQATAEHQGALARLAELQAAHEELQAKHRDALEQGPAEAEALRLELAETSDALVTLEGALTEAQEERDRLAEELEELKNGDQTAREVSKHLEAQAQLRKELQQHQDAMANVKSELLRSKSEVQGLLEERARQDSLLRETQIKLTIAETRAMRGGSAKGSSTTGGDGSQHGSPSEQSGASATGEFGSNGYSTLNGRRTPMGRRGSVEEVSSPTGRGPSGSLPVNSAKPPPPTPPPSMPVPPLPPGATPSRNSLHRTSTASSTRPESPHGLSRSSSTHSMNTAHASVSSGFAHADPKAVKLLADQAEELKSLARQLSHCEQDLQANIDLVATLEAALNDSERSLRKSRVQLSEVTRERDRYAAEADDLRQQISMAQREADAVRNSVMLEKQGYESRLQAEREAKEKARRALESRLEEVQRKKNSRLFCI